MSYFYMSLSYYHVCLCGAISWMLYRVLLYQVAGRVGSGQEVLKSRGSGRVSGRVGSADSTRPDP